MTVALPIEADPLCREDPELFFTEPGRNDQRITAAKKICAACPFQAPCLDYSLAHSVVGVWGGTDEVQRRVIRDERGIVPVPIVTYPYPSRRRAA